MIGAGAVGGVVGGRLAEHGHDVVLVARGAHLRAIGRDGLTVHDPEGSVTVSPPAVASVAEVDWGDGDVAVVAVKSQDTASVLADLAPVAPAGLPVVCLQNGVANERAALRRFEHVHGVCVMLSCTHLESGVVLAHSAPVTGLLDIGRYPDGVDEVDRAVAAALSGSGFDSVPRADIMRWKHQKLLANLANAAEAACGPAARFGDLARRARAEGTSVLEEAGIPFTSDEEDARRRGSLLGLRPAGGRRWEGGSTWQSLARGTGRAEADWLNGEVVLLGRLHRVPTPANALLQEVANRMATEGTAPGSLDEADLLAHLSGPQDRRR